MKDTTLIIEKVVDKIFTLPRLRADFNIWLNENYSNLKRIKITEIDDINSTKIISISFNEALTPYKFYIEYDKFSGLWYTVNIAIGGFVKPDENGIMKIEKGIVKLYYNSDLSLYDAELFYDDMNA